MECSATGTGTAPRGVPVRLVSERVAVSQNVGTPVWAIHGQNTCRAWKASPAFGGDLCRGIVIWSTKDSSMIAWSIPDAIIMALRRSGGPGSAGVPARSRPEAPDCSSGRDTRAPGNPTTTQLWVEAVPRRNHRRSASMASKSVTTSSICAETHGRGSVTETYCRGAAAKELQAFNHPSAAAPRCPPFP